MAIEFDPKGDFAEVGDNLQAITLMRPGSSMFAGISKALIRSVITTDQSATRSMYVSSTKPASQKAVSTSDVAWHFSTSELSETPQPGDMILDANGQRWTVLAVKKMTLHTRWMCACRNLAVVHGDDLPLISVPT